MANVKNELAAIAAAQGYDGPTPTTIAGAVDALTTTLGGEPSGGTVAQSVRALAPNIGGGGSSGVKPIALSNCVRLYSTDTDSNSTSAALISDTFISYAEYADSAALVFGGGNASNMFVPAGAHVSIFHNMPFSGANVSVSAVIKYQDPQTWQTTTVGNFTDFTLSEHTTNGRMGGKAVHFVVPDNLGSNYTIEFTVGTQSSSGNTPS